MKWKLADATPHRIYLDMAFVEGLHQALDCGTGFEGACHLANEHASLPLEQCYIHCAETHGIEHGVEFKLVPNACRLTPHSNEHKVGKNLRLNHGIVNIVTILANLFHSTTFMALGVKLSLLTATKAKDLRNVHALRTHVSDEVYSAMLSLAMCEEHSDIQRTLNTICHSGPKAAAWLKDKLNGTKFALPALYQPMSLIPLAIWKASLSTTNGNEQAHHNAYHEGVHLTLLAGIMKGMKFDQGATSSINVHATFGVSTRDQEATQVYRATRCIVQQSTSIVLIIEFN
ncbi:hypothetical protein BD769DRAFT_1390092 [Suillus cothurnatus]|nr:hypothetical protein BD769DRAFT_1390092 [Suillus cothurnatus]